jgi:hypothetical protein
MQVKLGQSKSELEAQAHMALDELGAERSPLNVGLFGQYIQLLPENQDWFTVAEFGSWLFRRHAGASAYQLIEDYREWDKALREEAEADEKLKESQEEVVQEA